MAATKTQTFPALSSEEITQLADYVTQIQEEHFNSITKWEQDFISSMAMKFTAYEEKTFISHRQEEVIKRIAKSTGLLR